MCEGKAKPKESKIKLVCAVVVVLMAWAVGFLMLGNELWSSFGSDSGIVVFNLVLIAVGYYFIGGIAEKILSRKK